MWAMLRETLRNIYVYILKSINYFLPLLYFSLIYFKRLDLRFILFLHYLSKNFIIAYIFITTGLKSYIFRENKQLHNTT